MTDRALIDVQHLGKKFCRTLGRSMLYGLRDMGSDLLGRQPDRKVIRPDEYWGLDDVSFSVLPGDCLGVIGQNGAGKSTLLKLVSGIFAADTGHIVVRGRVSTLIEVGAGFHPMLSGRENIYINGAILGMTRREIDAKLDKIVDFSGIGPFLDSPVKHYSSGMYVRLGFSIAIHTHPDVLLVDEALAVGDAAFRVRCLNMIEQLKSQGTAILFVSHSEIEIAQVCDRCLLLSKGKTRYLGDPSDALLHYRRGRQANIGGKVSPQTEPDFASSVQIERVDVGSGLQHTQLLTGEPATVTLTLVVAERIDEASIELRLWNSDEQLVAVFDSAQAGQMLQLRHGRQPVRLAFDTMPLLPGQYRLAGGVRADKEIVAWSVELAVVDIAARRDVPSNGMVYLSGNAQVVQDTAVARQAIGGGDAL